MPLCNRSFVSATRSRIGITAGRSDRGVPRSIYQMRRSSPLVARTKLMFRFTEIADIADIATTAKFYVFGIISGGGNGIGRGTSFESRINGSWRGYRVAGLGRKIELNDS